MTEKPNATRRHFLSGLLGFFLGIIVCLIWQSCFSFIPKVGFHWFTQKGPQNKLLEPQLDLQDPFEQMQKLQQQLFRRALPPFPSDEMSPEVESGAGEVKQREDDKFVYLDISIRGLDRQSLSVEVVDGQVNLKGQVHIKRQGSNIQSEVIESFNRSFPAPENTDTKKVEIENTQDQLTLKFPKKS